MNIPVSRMKDDEEFLVEEAVQPQDLDLDIGVMRFSDNLQVAARAWKSRNDLTVDVRVEGTRRFSCSSCLEEFNNLFEKEITLHYDIRGQQSVNLYPELRDELMVDHPIRVLCRADCKGLCPVCGTDLNKTTCKCRDK